MLVPMRATAESHQNRSFRNLPAAARTALAMPLCVFETGNPAGRELMLIHGFSRSDVVFKPQYEGSLARDFRIVALDLRGHGCSGKP